MDPAPWQRAAQTGEPLSVVLDQAVETYRRQCLLAQANAAYAALRSSPAAWAEEEAEREAWLDMPVRPKLRSVCMHRLATLSMIVLAASTLCAKQARTFYTDADLKTALAKVQKYSWAQSNVKSAEAGAQRWVDMSDEDLWNFVPPPEQLRALNVSFGVGCPVHGGEVFRKGGHYPWTTDSAHPFKVKCPVGGEEYPGNDFQPWNPKSISEEPATGPGYHDNGAGWTDGKHRYWFVGYYVFWHRWQKEVLPAIPALAQAYLLTGKPIYAHKCAVLLGHIAQDWEKYDYPTQAYHNGLWPARINGRILDYIWSTGTVSNLSKAYDAIYPALTDPEIAGFLKTKQIESPREFMEQKMLRVMAGDIMRGFIRGNMGMHQQALATLAIVFDNQDEAKGPTSKQMADWIMTGPGDSEYLLWNGFYRDGLGGESSPGYSSGWISNFYQVAKLMPRLGVDIWSNPKLKKMADIGIDLTVAGIRSPAIGDAGSIMGAGKVGWAGSIQGPAFMHGGRELPHGDPRFAKVLQLIGAQSESLWESEFDPEKVAAVVAREGTEIEYKTRDLGGYGVAILESGAGSHRRGVSMYYGHAGGGHGHRDRLTIEMQDSRFKAPVLSDMGYPAHWNTKCTYWTTNTVSHYDVVVNQGWQQTMYGGALNTLASAPGLQLADAAADKVAYPSAANLYRRTLALIDLSPDSSYVLDVFRVHGGWEHDYSFHGPAFPEFTVAGGQPGPVQEKGTLAGAEVAFGEKPEQSSTGAATYALRGGEGVLDDKRDYGARSLEGWSTYYSGPEALCRKEGAVMSIKAKLPAGEYKLYLRAYDYNAGANVVDITAGGQTQSFKWEPSGQVGYRWVSQVYKFAQPVDRITLTAKQVGQSYVLLEGLTATTDLEGNEPRVWDPATSGFQYLYNVRRMKPAGAWSATWRDPETKLALTMHMPEQSANAPGGASEIILADAEPELQPGAPKSLQYVLARNVSEGDDLQSAFVTVSEPHEGAAQIQSVKRLTAAQAEPGTVGLAVALADGRHLIHSSLNPGEPVTWQDGKTAFKVAGEFAVLRLDAQGVRSGYLVNGTQVEYGDFALKAVPSPAGQVVAVDHAHNSITIDAVLGSPEAYRDRVVILGNELHQTSYTIKHAVAKGGQTELQFGDVLYVVGMGKVTGVDQKAGTVTTDTTLTGYGRVDGGQHQGRWLYNEDKSQGFRIAAFSGSAFKLERVEGDLATLFGDKDGDGLARFWISDIGPGDTFRIPTTTYVERIAPGQFRVQMMTEVQLGVKG